MIYNINYNILYIIKFIYILCNIIINIDRNKTEILSCCYNSDRSSIKAQT